MNNFACEREKQNLLLLLNSCIRQVTDTKDTKLDGQHKKSIYAHKPCGMQQATIR